MLLYAGIDEAGYGPMLGPLCVGLASLWIQPWTPGAPRPDPWAMLRTAVSDAPDRGGRLVVADSKRVCRPLASGRKRLAEAERTLLAVLACAGRSPPTTDLDLFEALGTGKPTLAWYGTGPRAFPTGADRAEAGVAGNALRAALASAAVGVGPVAVERIEEDRFNATVTRGLPKGEVTMAGVAVLGRRVLADVARARADGHDAHARIVLDRQGGRTRYAGTLERALGEGVRVVAESEASGVYELRDRHWVRVVVEPKADGGHFVVALASMAAKLVRELSMERFNAYWATRAPGVRPTAGYATDARRWLADMEGHLTANERRSLVRLA